jgi:phospho-N-acetylmuramoyl-pentapeptide-transferase
LQIGESVRDLGLDGQKQKEGTPTMGGVIIFLSIMLPCLLLADLTNIYIQLLLLSTLWMAIIGFIDDYIKVFLKDKKGLSGKFKIMGQVVLGLIVGFTMVSHDDVVVRMQVEEANRQGFEIVEQIGTLERGGQMVEMAYVKTTLTNVPFIKGNLFDYTDLLFFLGENASTWVWVIFVPIIIFIVTAVSNGSNLTDGLDGLATGVSAVIAGTLGILAYVSGNTIFADYLNILYLPYTGELIVFSACLIGACIGFLWYNAYPAKVFMGDTGSLMLGGIIAALAVVIRKELLIPLLCGIFLIESLSVLIQVSYFKFTKKRKGVGKRVFLMAPIHHHYQKRGMHEAKIVTRFWIVAIMCAVLTIITLKVR